MQTDILELQECAAQLTTQIRTLEQENSQLRS